MSTLDRRIEESRANAQLIAAAPDMLFVLTAIAEFWHQGGGIYSLSPDAMIMADERGIFDWVKDTLHQATGGEPWRE
jgi:hypothetical protein